MRQAGILAAAALYALDHNIERLAEDHANAGRLAEAIAALPGIKLDPATVETNIIIFEVDPARLDARRLPPETTGADGPLTLAARFVAALRERGVWMIATAPLKVRAVTHLDVAREQIDLAIAAFRALCCG